MDRVLTLMLDGIWGRPKRFEGLIEMLREQCGPAEIFHYDSSGRVPFEQLGTQLAEEIRRRDQPVNLIGFSMGGLVVRAAHLLDPTLPIRKAAFLNSPHGGSLLAYVCPIGGIRQIRPSDSFIQRLKRVEWAIPTLATWCPWDTMVIPGRSARMSGAQEMICCAVPIHTWPIFSGGIWRRVVRFFGPTADCKEVSS
jgi:pimeloyl-ACP methyl ester carboxylesterase